MTHEAKLHLQLFALRLAPVLAGLLTFCILQACSDAPDYGTLKNLACGVQGEPCGGPLQGCCEGHHCMRQRIGDDMVQACGLLCEDDGDCEPDLFCRQIGAHVGLQGCWPDR